MAQAKPIAAGSLLTGQGKLAGYSFRETAGAAASVKLFDNAAAGSGTLLATIGFTANQSKEISQLDLWFQAGVFAVVTGTVEGSVYVD